MAIDVDKPRLLGYARVSSTDQNLATQVEQLKAAGCARIFAEKVSGASANGRVELGKLMKELAPGDVVLVTRLDRFARSIRDLLNLLDQIKAAGASFRSLADSWCDLSSPQGRLIMNIMGSLAEFERDLIRQRCAEGIKRAKAAGIHMGRPFKLNVKQRKLIVQRREQGESLSQIASALDVSTATVWRALQ